MIAATAARRLLVLAIVVVAHALALALLELTRTHRPGGVAAESMTLVKLAPGAHPRPLELPPTIPRPLARGERAALPRREAPTPPSQPPPHESGSAAIDWVAEGADAAARVARGGDASPRARRFGVPPPSPMFAPRPARRPGFAWNHARTHRVEVLPGGVTVFNINDHCAIALLWIVPAFGCVIGRILPRGDLFEHMRDPDPQEPDLP